MPPLTATGYALVGLTLVGGILLLVLVVMIARVASGRGPSVRRRDDGGESAMLSAVLEDAVGHLKTQ